MDPIILPLIIGGALLYFGGKKKKKKGCNLKPGDHPIPVGQECVLNLPRNAGFWHVTPIAPSSASIKVFAHIGDPLNILRVQGVSAGAVKLQIYSDAANKDLVAEYMFQVIGETARSQTQTLVHRS